MALNKKKIIKKNIEGSSNKAMKKLSLNYNENLSGSIILQTIVAWATLKRHYLLSFDITTLQEKND